MKNFFRYVFIVGSIAIVLILVGASVEKLFKLNAMDTGSMLFPEGSIEHHYKNHLLLGYLHIVPGLAFLVLGGHQIIPYFRLRNYPLHRTLGKVFLLLSALLFSTAIVLGPFYPFGNILESVVTLVFGLYLLFATYKAYSAARNKQFEVHKKWVTRLYFVALSVSTIRGIIALFMIQGAQTMQAIFGLAFLLAFILHFILVEIWIRYLAK